LAPFTFSFKGFFAALLVAAAMVRPVAAQGLTATLTYPADGAAGADLTQPMQWTDVENVEAYYLYVGTTAGSMNLVNTGEIQQTSYQAWNLPLGQTLYARMWTKVGGVWRFTDHTFSAAAVGSQTAEMVTPASGSTVEPTLTIQWTTVANAQAYYLYVGTSQGANDVVNTGEVQQTSYTPATLPENQQLYARIWTKVQGAWRYRDSVFSTGLALFAKLASPANGASVPGGVTTFQWTAVSGVQAYYLYVGSTAGAKDLVNTGEIQSVSYAAVSLPQGQTLYARLWTRVGGVWRYSDSTFALTPSPASLLSPQDGASVESSTTFQWTSTTGAQAYYLYVGTTQGAKDVVNTGEIQQTSYAASLPEGATLHVRLWTRLAGAWLYRDSQVHVPTVRATFIAPADGSPNVDLTSPFAWTSVPEAQAYFLYVGTSAGASDVLSTGEIQQTQIDVLQQLPTETQLFARLWTKVGGIWRYVDASFATAPLQSRFLYPQDKQHAADLSLPFQWLPVGLAQGYRLYVSTSPSLEDVVFDSGVIFQTQLSVSGLPSTQPLFARVLTNVHGIWTFADAVFTAEPSSAPATIQTPADGATGISGAEAFRWAAVPLAQAYRLRIGTTPGGEDVHDTGATLTTARFVPDLPAGVPLYGTLSTELDGVWQATSFQFTVGSSGDAVASQRAFALEATVALRGTADASGFADIGSLLAREVMAARRAWAFCTQFATGLVRLLTDAGAGQNVRVLNVAFNTNTVDGHTLVEMFDDDLGGWMLLDPLFAMTPHVAGDGRYATAEEIKASVEQGATGDIQYEALAPNTIDDLQAYYIDYPLLYLNLYRAPSDVFTYGAGDSPLPHLIPVSSPASADAATYAVQCAEGAASVGVRIDGVDTSRQCDGIDRLTGAFVASDVELLGTPPAGTTLFRLPRLVF
jgi:hypothetical protein